MLDGKNNKDQIPKVRSEIMEANFPMVLLEKKLNVLTIKLILVGKKYMIGMHLQRVVIL